MGAWVGYPQTLRKKPAKKYVDAVRDARNKLRIGQEYRREVREHRWDRSERQYEGDHWSIDGIPDSTSDLIVVNMSFSTVNVINPYMTGSSPRFLVSPYSGDATPLNATLQQALLNRIWRSDAVGGQEHLEVCAGDFLIYGDGYLKVGFDIKTTRTSQDEWSDVALIWVQRIDPWDVWIDPSSNGLHDARWVCQRLRITKQELMESSAYFNTHDENVAYGVGNLSVDDHRRDTDESEVAREVYDGSEWAEVYEFYDLVHNKMISFSAGELPIRWVDDIGGSAIVQMGNYRIPNSPYHFGELEPIWELQAELNKTRSHLITHRRRNVAKVFAKKNALGTEAIQALQSPVVFDVAFVDGDQPLDQLVTAVQLPNLSVDVYSVAQTMQDDIYEISGVNEYLRGASPAIRRTATEASIIEGASNVKSQFKLRQVEKASKKVGTIMLATMKDVFPRTDYDEIQLYLTGKDAEKVTRASQGELMAGLQSDGASPEEMGIAKDAMPSSMDVSLSPSEDIFTGSYEVEVEHESTELRNPQLKEQKYKEMASELVQMSPALQQMGVQVNIRAVLEMWFEAAGVDDVDSLFDVPALGPGVPPAPGGGVPGGIPGGIPGAPAPGGGGGLPPSLDPSMIAQLMGGLDTENTGALPPEI
jgi:hypothetical protein